MQTRIIGGLQVLRRTTAFLAKEVDIPVKMGPIAKLVAAFNVSVDRLASLAAEQHESIRGFQDVSRKARELARAIVREYVRPVTSSGKFLFPVESPVRSTLKLPNGGDLRYEALIAAVEGIAGRLEEHKAKFVELGFGDDFVEKLRGAVAELKKALEEKSAYFGRRSAATSGLLLEFGRAREMVRMLDAMIAPRLEGTERLAQWKTLSRFARVKREEEPGEIPIVPPSVPVPSTPAAPVVTSTSEVGAA